MKRKMSSRRFSDSGGALRREAHAPALSRGRTGAPYHRTRMDVGYHVRGPRVSRSSSPPPGSRPLETRKQRLDGPDAKLGLQTRLSARLPPPSPGDRSDRRPPTGSQSRSGGGQPDSLGDLRPMFCFCLAALQVGASIWAFHAGRGAPVVSLSAQVSAAHPRPRLIPLTPSLAASSQPSRPCPPGSLRRWLPLSSLGDFG